MANKKIVAYKIINISIFVSMKDMFPALCYYHRKENAILVSETQQCFFHSNFLEFLSL